MYFVLLYFSTLFHMNCMMPTFETWKKKSTTFPTDYTEFTRCHNFSSQVPEPATARGRLLRPAADAHPHHAHQRAARVRHADWQPKDNVGARLLWSILCQTLVPNQRQINLDYKCLIFQIHDAGCDCAAHVELLLAVASRGDRRKAGDDSFGHVATEYDGHQHHALKSANQQHLLSELSWTTVCKISLCK